MTKLARWKKEWGHPEEAKALWFTLSFPYGRRTVTTCVESILEVDDHFQAVKVIIVEHSSHNIVEALPCLLMNEWRNDLPSNSLIPKEIHRNEVKK